MSALPLVKRRWLEKFLAKQGFEKVNATKAHAFFKHEDGRVTTVPTFRGRKISQPLLNEILDDIGIEPVVFLELMKEV